jgi:PAS domain S-box-containing protein
MTNFLERILDSSMFSPHGICLLWEPELIWLHVVSDALIALAYFSIPFALAIFVLKRKDLKFGWLYWSFGIFIMACGLTHVLSIYTLWVPVYGIEGLVKAATAAASIFTAGMLWPLLPKLLTIPSPFEFRQVQEALKDEEIKARDSENLLAQFRAAQRAQRESMARLTAVVETAVDGFILIDARGRILLFNPACERLFGYQAAEVFHENVKMLMPPVYSDHHDRYVSSFLRTGERKIIGTGREVIGLRKDGSTFPMELSVGEAKQDGESIFVGIVHDLTGRKHTEEQLRQSQKMEIVGQLSGGIAHDFNNLLTVMIGNAEHLGEQLKSREDLRRIADDICRSGERGAELTQRLLAFSRRQFLQPLAVDCHELLDSMHKLLRRTLREDIEIATAFNPGGIFAFADRTQLESAVLNLALNAQDAMPSGGRLTLSTDVVALDGQDLDAHPEVPAGQYALIAVTDNGEGMTSEVVGRVFEPFYTTKEGRQGLGPRLEHGLRIRQAVERSRLDLQRAGAGHDGAPLSAARRRRCSSRPRAGNRRGRRPRGHRDNPGGRGRSVRPRLGHAPAGEPRLFRDRRGRGRRCTGQASGKSRDRHAVYRYRHAGRHERLGTGGPGPASPRWPAGGFQLRLRAGHIGRKGARIRAIDRSDKTLSQG